MPGDALTPAPGWLGKLPCRGDFVSGGAPSALIEGWRAWALAGLPAVRALGVAGRDAFLTAAPVRFAVAPGVFGAAQGVGLFGPGADAAGRLFPFVVAVETPVDDPAATLAATADWLTAVEAAYRAALGPVFDPTTFAPPPLALTGPPGALQLQLSRDGATPTPSAGPTRDAEAAAAPRASATPSLGRTPSPAVPSPHIAPGALTAPTARGALTAPTAKANPATLGAAAALTAPPARRHGAATDHGSRAAAHAASALQPAAPTPDAPRADPVGGLFAADGAPPRRLPPRAPADAALFAALFRLPAEAQA